jgi:hypothetical protein
MPPCRSFRETQLGAVQSGSYICPLGSPTHPAASFVADQQRSKRSADVFGAVEKFIRHDYVLRTYREALAARLQKIARFPQQIVESAIPPEGLFPHVIAPQRSTESKAA